MKKFIPYLIAFFTAVTAHGYIAVTNVPVDMSFGAFKELYNANLYIEKTALTNGTAIVDRSYIVAGAISATEITNSAITRPKLVANIISATEITNTTITAAKMAEGYVASIAGSNMYFSLSRLCTNGQVNVAYGVTNAAVPVVIVNWADSRAAAFVAAGSNMTISTFAGVNTFTPYSFMPVDACVTMRFQVVGYKLE